MAEGRDSTAWNHTAVVLAMIANQWRGSDDTAAKPEDFHPYLDRTEEKPPMASIDILKPLCER